MLTFSLCCRLSPNSSPPSLLNSPDYQQLNLSPEKLQHDLLIELQGDPADLKSKAWYHGNVSRQRAERLVAKNGDFLVRDCISQPGDFVLSCCWKGGPLHFVINSSVLDQGPYQLPKVTYHFETTHYISVEDLIQFYMDECKQITEITGAVITTPIARSMPLTYYDSKYGALSALANTRGSHYSTVHSVTHPANHPAANHPAMVNPVQNQSYQRSPHVTPGVSPKTSPHGTPGVSPRGTPGASPRGSPRSDRRQRYVERAGSQPMLALNDKPVYISPAMDRSDSLPVITGSSKEITHTPEPLLGDTGIYKTVTPAYSATPAFRTAPPGGFIHHRSGSAPVLTPGVTVTQHYDSLPPPRSLNPTSSDSDLSKAPPPKPSRIPSVKYKKKPHVQIRNVALYEDDSRDYSDYSQVTSEPSWLKTGQPNQEAGVEFKSSNQMPSDNVYDNNYKGVSQSNRALHEKDVNQNISIKGDSSTKSESLFKNMDGRDYSEIPAFPLELNLKKGQARTHQQVGNKISQNWKHRTNQNAPNQTEILNVKHSKLKIPIIEIGPSFNLDIYKSALLPNENKLLEPSSLINVRELLLRTNARLLAQYLTKADLDILKVLNENDLGVKVTSGLELITLPQGKQLRQDLLER